MTPETIAAGLAFFQGKRVAVKVSFSEFRELPQFSLGISFDDCQEYRILPDLPWYRVALLKGHSGTWTLHVTDDLQESETQTEPYFVGWLGERKTYAPEQVGK